MILALLTFLLSLPSAAPAQPLSVNFALAGLVPLSMPLEPLADGRWNVSLAPAYVKTRTFNTVGNNNDHKDVSGWGAAGSVAYGLTDHFGLAATALGFSGKGDWDAGPPTPGLYDTKTSGGMVALSLVWDYFDGEGFRLPILAGLHYESLREETAFGAGVEQKIVSPGFQVGLSPQFNTGPVRWEPLVMVYRPFDDVEERIGGVLQPKSIHSDTGGPQPALNVVWRPWNLSFFFMAGVSKAKGTRVYSLRWKKSFGA